MQRKVTLFEYLYQSLRDEIISGRIPCGSPLPSITRLCELYHVGSRTVRDVLARLKQEGYIKTEERRPMIVIYQPKQEDQAAAAYYILTHRQSILDAYASMTQLMPRILSFSLQTISSYSLEYWKKALKSALSKNTEIRWKSNIKFFYALLDETHNLFFRDLFSSLELYARPMFFFQEKQFSKLIQEHCTFQNAMWFQEPMLNGQIEESYCRLTQMYTSVYKAVQQQMVNLATQYPQIKQENHHFTWQSDRGRDHLHVQITRDLINHIGTGSLPTGTLLPPEAKLAHHYHVSIATIRKALASLNELGYAKTQNVKGTTICMQDDETAIRCLARKPYRQDALRYLSGLQLMILVIKPAACSAFSQISPSTVIQLRIDLQNRFRIPLDLLTEVVILHVKEEALKTILCELSRILCWGYYYSLYPGEQHAFNALNCKSMKAVQFLENEEKEAFARQMCLCYVHILEVIRSHMIQYKLPEAAYLKTPEKIFL